MPLAVKFSTLECLALRGDDHIVTFRKHSINDQITSYHALISSNY